MISRDCWLIVVGGGGEICCYFRTSPRRSSSTSPYLHAHTQRGRPPNGSRVGRIGFKGVRQRKGVRGYLVEIRPPKWKKTIWLGTYNSDREAAGAYDAGIFYTNKKTKYNFPVLQGTFPPLPQQLRLDNADDSEEIKTFVQREAREAARKVKSLAASPIPAAAAVEPTWTSSTDDNNINTSPNIPVSSATSSSEESTSDQEISHLIIPEDDFSFLQQISNCWDLGWPHFDCMKQEEISLGDDLDMDGVDSGFMHSLVWIRAYTNSDLFWRQTSTNIDRTVLDSAIRVQKNNNFGVLWGWR